MQLKPLDSNNIAEEMAMWGNLAHIKEVCEAHNQLLAYTQALEKGLMLAVGQIDYISAGHNMGITNKDEHYMEISKLIKNILEGRENEN